MYLKARRKDKVFYHLGLDNTVLNMKASPETVNKTNDYFDYIEKNCAERDGINIV